MRNAVAHFDDDFTLDEPVRKPKALSRKTRAPSPKKKTAARAKKGKTRYLHVAAIGLSGSLVIGIMINALALQHSRHPAPLFGKAIQLGAPVAPAAAVAPVAAPAVLKSAEPAQSIAPAPAAPAQSVPMPVQRPHRAAAASEAAPPAKTKQDDPIAKLLKASNGSSAADHAPEKDSPKIVSAAQHALMKLGFVIKPNGTFGPTTKAAIEAFERDHHLPVKGELSRKILKQLSAESGVAID